MVVPIFLLLKIHNDIKTRSELVKVSTFPKLDSSLYTNNKYILNLYNNQEALVFLKAFLK